jgi:hypothetical protein
MALDDVVPLQQPLKDGGIRSVNFFNGRLLSSRDLTRVEVARREADWRLGLAVGNGVAFGLDVERDTQLSKDNAPVVRVKSGLAVSRRGQTLRLARDTSVALTRSFEAAASDCAFVDCKPIVTGTYISGAGVYVLTAAPAQSSEGKAPTNGLDPSNVRCNTDTTIEGIQFRLHAVKKQEYFSLGIGDPWFRNALAYRCFGNDVQPGWFGGLLEALPRRDGLLEGLRETSLTDHDVPLALIYITGVARIEFIDQWAVRRPLCGPAVDAFASLVDGQRPACGQAMFLQFQRHVLELAAPSGDLGPVTARSHFKFLPPVGVIPVPEERDQSDGAATRFFAGMTYRGPAFINAARLEGLVRESLGHPPIDAQGREVLWLYRVRENRMAIDLAGNRRAPGSYLVFASGHLPYRANAQFDLGYWNYANYAVVP